VDIGQIALVLFAVAVGQFAKGLTGIGGPMFAIPVLASFMGVEYAVAVIAIPSLVGNGWLVWEHRAAAGTVKRFLVPMLAAGCVGVGFGVWFLVSFDDRVLSLILAVVVLVYIAVYLAKPTFHLGEKAALRIAAPVGFLAGGMHGATGISAPVVATYTHSLDLPRAAFVFAVTLPFGVLGAVQMVSLVFVGAYDAERVVAGLIAVIPVLVVLPIAMRLGDRLSHRTFQLVVLVVLGAAAIRLLWTVFA
jgi:uncharacterized membrane protein YfcA